MSRSPNLIGTLRKRLLVRKCSEWSLSERRKFFEDVLEPKLGIRYWKDWYGIKTQQALTAGGAVLLSAHYSRSLTAALLDLYREYPWDLTQFEKVSPNFWSDPRNHRLLLDQVSKELNIQRWEDWYQVRKVDAIKISSAIDKSAHKNKSFSQFIMDTYPEHPWQAWRFKNGVGDMWNDVAVVNDFLKWAASRLGVEKLEDWNLVSNQQVKSLGFEHLQYYGGIKSLVKKCYPEFDVKSNVRLTGSSKGQSHLFKQTSLLFPSADIHNSFKQFSPENNMELDVFIPSLSLALEFQGGQHYTALNQRRRLQWADKEATDEANETKRRICNDMGITLIEIPFWWDHTIESLAATIRDRRPDLLSDCEGRFQGHPSFKAIPPSPPEKRPNISNTGLS